MPERPTLIVMLKVPQAGRVKTRLGRDIGMVAAAWWFRHQVAALLRRLRDPRWQIVLAVSPDGAARGGRFWPRDLPRIAQGPGDLGQRMTRAMARFPNGPVCVVGADIPGLRRKHIARSFAAFGRAGAVFGPALDGGFWLVGLKRGGLARRGLFDGVRWSTPEALSDSEKALRAVKPARIDTLADVDRAADLPRGRP